MLLLTCEENSFVVDKHWYKPVVKTVCFAYHDFVTPKNLQIIIALKLIKKYAEDYCNNNRAIYPIKEPLMQHRLLSVSEIDTLQYSISSYENLTDSLEDLEVIIIK